MWYKTAKQGSVWSRIGPDAEAQFDELLKQATNRFGTGEIYVDIRKLDKLFRKSNFKNLIIRFILKEKLENSLGHFDVSLFDKIEKLASLEKFIPKFLANKIRINQPEYYKLSYQAQISLLKHEFAHAITSHTIDFLKNEAYLQPNMLTKDTIGRNLNQTNLLKLRANLRNNIVHFDDEISNMIGYSFRKLLFYDDLPTSEKLNKINEIWKTFQIKIHNKEISVSKDVKKIIETINKDVFHDGDVLELYRQRAKTLGDGNVDVYYANPEETRAHIVEMQHLFSKPLLKQYYDHLIATNVYSEENSKQQYLEDIKKMFNIFMGTTYKDIYMGAEWVDKYYSPQKYAAFFGLEQTYNKFLYKANDRKFKEQVAKHLGNVYQELRNEFNSQL